MRCWVQIISTPAADTPGTLLVLHFDNKRYLIGTLAEGAQRICSERGVSLRKVEEVFLTGRTAWAHVGGLLGMILTLADVKLTARDSFLAERAAARSRQAKEDGHKRPGEQQVSQNVVPDGGRKPPSLEIPSISLHGAPNLNYLLATTRRFVFRTGVQMLAQEYAAGASTQFSEPTWSDENIRVWAIATLPENSNWQAPESTVEQHSNPGKHLDSNEPSHTVREQDQTNHSARTIVNQMFNSTWRYDHLVTQKLCDVKTPATVFIRDQDTKHLTKYTGPMPGGESAVPDIEVLVREPWPGAGKPLVLGNTKPAKESVSYIFRNHPQRGKFLPEKATKLNVPKYHWKNLASGRSVTSETGELVTPDMVLTPGKQGGGMAVIEVPDINYLEPILQRPEWRDPTTMDGVEVIIWILGRGVASDQRLHKFQRELSTAQHIVSSADACPDRLMLEGAARTAFRHNYIDQHIYPKPNEYSLTRAGNIGEYAVLAQPGQLITLEPEVKLEDTATQPLDISALEEKIAEELCELKEARDLSNSNSTEDDIVSWNAAVLEQDVEIVVLGTGSSHPSKHRNVSGTLVRVPGCGSYLLDCGEGTLGTLKRLYSPQELAEIMHDLKMIWISHLHADHHLGITSLLKEWHRTTQVPTDLRSDFSVMPSTSSRHLAVISNLEMHRWLYEYSNVEDIGMSRIMPLATLPRYVRGLAEERTLLKWVKPMEDNERKSDTFSETAGYLGILNLRALDSVYVNHCHAAQAVSLTFKSGFKISYSGDCRPSAEFATIGRHSHVLIHEATFEDDMRGEAIAKKHSTAGEAMIVACEMKAKACLLTHFSQRYPTLPPLGAQAGLVPKITSLEPLARVLERGDQIDEPDSGTSIDGQVSASQSKMDAATQTNALGSKGMPSSASRKRLSSNGKTADESMILTEAEIETLVRQHGVKTIFAFDYMRFRMRDIPRLLKKQPLLREMYARGLGKDVDHDQRDEDQKSSPTRDEGSARQQKKRAKAERAASAERTGKSRQERRKRAEEAE